MLSNMSGATLAARVLTAGNGGFKHADTPRGVLPDGAAGTAPARPAAPGIKKFKRATTAGPVRVMGLRL